MSMPIQRQSEAFGIFDDGPRFARDRSSTDLPRGLAGLINTTGPRITGGLLNTRTAGEKLQPGPWTGEDWERAENHDPTDKYRNHPDSWSHQPTEQDYADWEAKNSRTAAGYDFGRGPRDHGGAGPDGGPALPNWYYDERDSDDEDDEDFGDPERFIPEHLVQGNRRGSRHPFDRAAAARLAKDGGCTCWEGYERVPGTEPCASKSCRKKTAAPTDWSQAQGGPLVDSDLREQDPDDYFRWRPHSGPSCPTCDRPLVAVSGPDCRHGSLHTAAPVDPAQMQVPMGGGFQIGHRVGLPWRDQVIPGTVIGLDGPSVVTRWDDGQYSTEEPRNIQLL